MATGSTSEPIENAIDIKDIEIHLKKQPIASIYENCNEKDNSIALILMCVVDFSIQRDARNLYDRMKNVNPKLMSQLLQFHSYSMFTYYDYQMNKTKLGKLVFQCSHCQLIGPVACILTHLAINHNIHLPGSVCVYCKHKEFRRHFDDNTFDECYKKYILKNDIKWDENVCSIIYDFYDVLKRLAVTLNVCVSRQHGYAAKGRASVEKLNQDYGKDFPTECTVFNQKTPQSKATSKNVLTQFQTLFKVFVDIVSYQYGGNRTSRLTQTQPTRKDVIVINDNDDGDSRAPLEQPMDLSHVESSSETVIKTEAEMDLGDPINEIIILPNGDTLLDRRQSFESTASTLSTSFNVVTSTQSNHIQKTSEQQFGDYVAQRLARLPNDLCRRKLENAIQEAIVKAEKDAFQ